MKFKKIVLTASAGLLFTIPAIAQDSVCKSQEIIAKSIMTMRQHGVAASTAVEKAEETAKKAFPSEEQEKIRNAWKNLLVTMTLLAYEQPRYNQESYKQGEIQDFGDFVYTSCLKAENE